MSFEPGSFVLPFDDRPGFLFGQVIGPGSRGSFQGPCERGVWVVWTSTSGRRSPPQQWTRDGLRLLTALEALSRQNVPYE